MNKIVEGEEVKEKNQWEMKKITRKTQLGCEEKE